MSRVFVATLLLLVSACTGDEFHEASRPSVPTIAAGTTFQPLPTPATTLPTLSTEGARPYRIDLRLGFDRGPDGFSLVRLGGASRIGWNAAGQRIAIFAEQADRRDTIFARDLGVEMTPDSTFMIRLRWGSGREIDAGGAYAPLFVGRARVARVGGDASVLAIRRTIVSESVITSIRYRDELGRARIEQSHVLPSDEVLTIAISYESELKLLEVTITGANGSALARARYRVGSSPNDGFRFREIGVATLGFASGEKRVDGWIDDVEVRAAGRTG